MATAGDECDICTELLKNPRILDCDHMFCLDCLEKLEYKKTIKCPNCRKETDIPTGLQVRHLRKKKNIATKPNVSVVHSWIVKHMITEVVIDEDSDVLFIAIGDKGKPIKEYSMNGKYTGYMSADVDLQYTRLTVDTKRGLILAMSARAIVVFDREGTQVATIKCSQFLRLLQISYHVRKDVYIVADIKARCLFYVSPNTNKVVKTIPALTEGELQSDTTMCITCDKSGTLSTWATCDRTGNTVRLYDSDGDCIKVWDNKGSGVGQIFSPGGLYMDSAGQLLVSDMDNHRIVRLDPGCIGENGEWKVLVNTQQFGLGHPRMIDITQDGIAVVVFWSSLDGPFNVGLLNGLY